MGRLWVVAAVVCVFTCIAPSAVLAQAEAGAAAPAAVSPLGLFNRDLVEKVKRSCIYIGIMMDYGGVTSFAGSGSGVIIMGLPEENAALAITNHHVAGKSINLQVETWTGQTFKAQMLATDPGIDASLIKIFGIAPEDYDAAVLGNSDEVQVGEPALAIGAPGVRGDMANVNRSDPLHSSTLQRTTTMSVVVGREYNPVDCIEFWASYRGEFGPSFVTNLPFRFATTASINPGNSGGPMFNSKGQVIGLNHAGGSWVNSQRSNRTIPINSVKKLVFEYLDKGTYEIPWFGIDMILPQHYTDPTQIYRFCESMDFKTLTVLGVRKDSPAQRAGLQQGDLIVEFDQRTFASVIDLRTYVFGMDIGKQVPVVVKRGKREVELMLEVGIKRKYDSEFSL